MTQILGAASADNKSGEDLEGSLLGLPETETELDVSFTSHITREDIGNFPVLLLALFVLLFHGIIAIWTHLRVGWYVITYAKTYNW